MSERTKETALRMACKMGYWDVAQKIVASPAALADEHLRTDAGRGALQSAVKAGRAGLVLGGARRRHSTLGVGKMGPDPAGSATIASAAAGGPAVTVPCGRMRPQAGTGGAALLYNEYVVYDARQVVPRYLVELDFGFK